MDEASGILMAMTAGCYLWGMLANANNTAEGAQKVTRRKPPKKIGLARGAGLNFWLAGCLAGRLAGLPSWLLKPALLASSLAGRQAGCLAAYSAACQIGWPGRPIHCFFCTFCNFVCFLRIFVFSLICFAFFIFFRLIFRFPL